MNDDLSRFYLLALAVETALATIATVLGLALVAAAGWL